MNAELTRCYAEQKRCATYLLENQGCLCSECHGARQGLSDWTAEELLIEATEAHMLTLESQDYMTPEQVAAI
jgi:hypothetical protein